MGLRTFPQSKGERERDTLFYFSYDDRINTHFVVNQSSHGPILALEDVNLSIFLYIYMCVLMPMPFYLSLHLYVCALANAILTSSP